MIKALYIHIPFCDHICTYCDFTKIFSKVASHKRYLEVLLNEINSLNIKDNSLNTIYIGGGTPSALTCEEIEILLGYLHAHFKNVVEFSFEANPESLNEDKIKILKKYGVNRVSLGVQSTDPSILEILGRKHTKEDVINALNLLKKYDIDNINIDFIYGIKEMSKEMLLKDIEFAIDQKTKHLSFYSLQVEDNTVLKNKCYTTDDEVLADMYEIITKKLEDNNFKHYEVSNFALPSFESKHNLTYWHDEEYYACGVSASSYINNKRYINTKSITRYLRKDFKREEENITKDDEEFEFLMLNLRLLDGFKLKTFKQRFNKDFLESYKKEIEDCKEYLSFENESVAIKKEYIYTMDNILLKLLKLK